MLPAYREAQAAVSQERLLDEAPASVSQERQLVAAQAAVSQERLLVAAKAAVPLWSIISLWRRRPSPVHCEPRPVSLELAVAC